MGGHGSGRDGWRAEIESLPRLDVRELRRQGQLAPAHPRTYKMAVRMAYTWEGEPYQAELPLTRVPCRFGGWRYYFRCPRCARRVEVVILAGGRTWGCRRCLRVRYYSQGLAPADRRQWRADHLYARAGVEDDAGLVHKHKWMRWRTFNRLMDRANELQRAADCAFVERVARLFG